MMALEVYVTGPQIASKLHGDEEEMAFCLNELADSSSGPWMREVAHHTPRGEGRKIADFLRDLARYIEAAD
jgi:hypothetical protein